MIRLKTSLDHKKIRCLIWLVLTLFVLLGYLLQSVSGSAYYSMMMQANGTVTSPPVILQNGTAGTSTIYTNNTSAKVIVEAPSVYDFVDNNISNVDSNATIGTHSNFTAQQYGPDSLFDNLTEVDTGGPINDSENFVDDNTSNIDGVDDKGTHSNFTAQQYCDSYFDTLTEADTGGSTTYQIHPTNFTDSINNWNNEINAWDGNNATSATETKGKATSNIYWHTWNNTDLGTISQVDLRVRLNLTGLSDDYVIISWYVGATQGTGTYEINSTNQGTDIVVTFSDVTEPINGTWEWVDIGNIEIRQDGTQAAGPDSVTYLVGEVWGQVSTSTPNYELDLEIRWTTADYDETNEELAVYVNKKNSHSLDAAGGYMIVGNGTVDWGSATGTISFWVKMDFSVQGRFWGQNGNMETRWSGTNLVLDWGATASMTSATSFSADTWYFIAIVWDENNDNLFLYVGDENNAPTLDANSLSGTWTSITPAPTENRFLNGLGGDQPVDGHGDELRYWNIARNLTEIQGDYDIELTGFEPNLRSYYKLNNDFDDIGPDDNDGSGSGTYSFSSDIPFNQENIQLDVWNGTTWQILFTNLTNGWNNKTVSSYLTSSTLIVRFLGGTEPGDSNQDSWQIECSLLHVWSWEYNYNLDLEIQWTDTNYTRTNEELCIKTGTFSGSEDIQVKVWNSTGSSWHWVMNLTAGQWNNASITSYLTSSTFTVQFLSGTETGDTSQDGWSIDAALLHVWTPASFGWGAWSEELLVNPGFEMGDLTGWTAKGPAAASVEVFNSTSGGDSYTNRSLRIGNYGVCTKDQPGTNDDSGVWQNVSLAAYASEIDAGNAVINASAWLYPSEWDWDDCALIVRFFNSSGGFISAWNTTGEYGNGTAYYPQAWMLGQGYAHFTQGQLKRFGCYNNTIPIGTRTVGIQLGMGEHKATNYCGGQADEASIKIRTSTWLSGWDKRVKITIGHNDIDSDLSDFPVLVYLSNSSGRNNDDLTFIFDEVGSNSKKIAVTKSDGTTQCYVEIEKWDNASEKAWLWVKVPNLSNITDTALYLYYDVDHPDNTDYVGDTDSTPAENVWDNNYVGVWHLKENPNGTAPQIKDSTLNGNDGTSNGGMNISDQVSGKIDGSLDFDNNNDYINVGDVNSNDWTAITVEGWIYHRDTGDDRVICKSVGTAIADHTLSLGVPNDIIRVRLGTDGTGGGTTSHDSSGFITPNTWTHVAFSWNSADATLRFYGDGQSRGSASKDGDTIKNSSQVVCIANVNTVDDRYFNGTIDEVRISNTTRSPAWVKASYESGRDNLLDFGASGTNEGTYDYVLRVNNTGTESWQIRLKKYSDSNISRLQNCTIYFHNSTDGTSNQIIIENGSYINQTGPWYDLGNLETIYIAMTVQANSAATSYIYAYLEIRTPNTTTYAQYVITFEIT